MSESFEAESGGARVARGATHRLLASATMLGGLTALVKLVAFAKDWLVAQRFGASDELDAMLVALVIPSYGVAVLGRSFGLAFVPAYIRLLHEEGSGRARRLVSGVLIGGPIVLGLITVALVLAAPYLLPLLGTGFDAAKLLLTQKLFHIVAAVILVSGVSNIFAAVLNAHERFVIPAAAPIAVPAVTVIVFLLGEPRYGVYALAAGTMLGFVAEWVILAIALRGCGLLPRPRWRAADADLRHVGAQYLPIALGSLLMSSSLVVDQSMAASLGSGSVSILSYGNKIVTLVLNIVAMSLSTVLLPRFSQLIATARWDDLVQMFRRSIWLIFAASAPAVVLLIVLAEPLIGLFFERGAFTHEATVASAEVQRWLVPQIPFYILAMIGLRLLSALDANRTVLAIGALNLVMNVTGNLVLMRWFGVRGIAMSTTLMYVVATVVTLVAIRWRLADVRPRA
jgi:putative peptidoglycan lipid II flippase